MRSEQEMMELILGVAKRDERIRAVYMNGSRTNPNAPKDIFQDYDIAYVVHETGSFIRDKDWIGVFGDLIMLQEANRLDHGLGRDIDLSKAYNWQMLFTDGNRIDLTIMTPEAALKEYQADTLTLPLLDKDGLLPEIPPPSDEEYHVKKPTTAEFDSCTNNFYWCLQNVAKGIWRAELPYVKQMQHETTRECLDQVVSWWLGHQHGYQISVGKMNKYFKRYLPAHYWEMYLRTYADADYDRIWEAAFAACSLFGVLAKELAVEYGYPFPEQDELRMLEYLRHVRRLPRDASQIF